MEKINLMEIAKTIKRLGYKVAINGREDAVFAGNDKNTIYICYDVKHIYYSLVCKECFCHINGIGDEITKENIDKALNSDIWKDKKTNPITIEEWINLINLKFLKDEKEPSFAIPSKPADLSPSTDEVTTDTKEKARDVLLRKMNEAIKEFEDETGVKVISIDGIAKMIMLEMGEVYDDISWKLNTKL